MCLPGAGRGWRAADGLAQGRLLVLGGCGLLLGSALAAGDERLYTAAVMPALRALPPEAAHGLALRAAALGLLPSARPDGPALVRPERGGAGGSGEVGRAVTTEGWGVARRARRAAQAAGSRRSPWWATRDPRAGTPQGHQKGQGRRPGLSGGGLERDLGMGPGVCGV